MRNTLAKVSLATVCLGLLLTLVCTTADQSNASAADWPQFRGPQAIGIAPDQGLSENWAQKPPEWSGRQIVQRAFLHEHCKAEAGDLKCVQCLVARPLNQCS